MSRAARSRWLPIVVLGAVLSLDSADRSTLSAVEAQLEPTLRISSTSFGFIAAVTPLVGLVVALPIGVLVDRVVRTRLLAACTAVWVVGEVVDAVAPSYAVLLVGRAALGAVLASVPAVTSLVGDLFAPERRARSYGAILAGELVGTAVGFLGTGALGAALGASWGFGALAVLGAVVSVGVWYLPEPARGGGRQDTATTGEPGAASGSLAAQLRRRGVRPTPSAVLPADPADLPVRAVLRYVLRVRTNLVLIAASSLSYLFLAGVQTFAVRFGTDQFGLGGLGATLVLVGLGVCAVAGVLTTGRIADRLAGRGRVDARVVVGAGTLLVALACFLPGTLVRDLGVALPLLLLGAVALGGANPPIDAARLDVLHHHAWGRGEAVRSVVRLVAYAVAPVLTGALIGVVGTGPAFAVLTAALALAGGFLLLAVRTYPGDVAAAVATPAPSGVPDE